MNAQIRTLAAQSPNFGFLFPYNPRLVLHGAAAESYVYSDPNASMVKARQFNELMAKTVATAVGLSTGGDHSQVIARLADAGVTDKRIGAAFTKVRQTGNRAVHSHFADAHAAVETVHLCFVLAVWFHRLRSGDREPIAFVPPAEPDAPAGANDADLTALRAELQAYRDRLAEVKLRLAGGADLQAAQEQAWREAQEALERARADKEQLRATIAELLAQQSVTADPPAPASPPTAAERDAFIQRAQIAAREPRTEVEVRREVDDMLAKAGWAVQDPGAVNLHAAQGVAVREERTGSGPADYLLYVGRKLVGVVEAKREGTILTQVEAQSDRYARSLTAEQQLTAWRTPLPFRYETTAAETHFTNALDPHSGRARAVFSFHRPETVARWMREADAEPERPTLRHRLRAMPPLEVAGLRPAQLDAVRGLETSLAADRPRALIQMATGAGKTYAAVTSSYRLLRHAKAQRILFLVDRNNLGTQAKDEFGVFVTPGDGRKFTELYNVDPLGAGVLDSTHVTISTVQRLYAMLRGRPLPPVDDDEPALDDDESIEVEYNADLPPETFDLIIVDECHRSIYGRWRSVLEYFDAYLVGLTATPVKQTFGFFQQNLVSEYTYVQAVADKVNVDFDVYRIKTEQTAGGATIDAGITVPRRDRRTRRTRYEELDDDLPWTPAQLGKSVISAGQLDLVLRTFRDRLYTEIFPGRSEVPKTLIFARDDNHAEEIVLKIREVFDRGNEFAAKITYSVRNSKALLAAFRNSAELRVAVTVDMIATGTDVRPLECLLFLRNPKSWALFEQMKGRGARVIDANDFQAVTPDALEKTRFVLVDAVGVTDSARCDAAPMARHTEQQISLEKLLQKTGTQAITPDEVATLASRLARLNQQITPDEREELERLADRPLTAVVSGLARCADVDELDAAEQAGPAAVRKLVEDAIEPLASRPELRKRLLEIRRTHDITYDEVNRDTLVSAEGAASTDVATRIVTSWRAYLEEHRNEIAAIELVYSGNGDRQGVYVTLKELAGRIARPPYQWTPDKLWKAYEQLDVAAARPETRYGPLDLIGLIRYELKVDEEPRPHRAIIAERFDAWIAKQRQAARDFTDQQMWWLERIRDVVATSASFDVDDLDRAPFTERGGTGAFADVFGEPALEVLEGLTHDLTA